MQPGWRSAEGTYFPPLWPGFDSRTRRRMFLEFVVGYRLLFFVFLIFSNAIKFFIIWQDSLEVNPSVLIGSFLVGILPYGPFPWKRSMLCIFLVFESRASKFKLRKENVQILSSSQRNYLKD